MKGCLTPDVLESHYVYVWSGDRLARIRHLSEPEPAARSAGPEHEENDGAGERPERDDSGDRVSGSVIEQDLDLDERTAVRHGVGNDYVWTWGEARPVRMEQRSHWVAGPPYTWTWDAGGRRARVGRVTLAGLREATSVLYDAAGRLIRIESERIELGSVRESLEPDGPLERIVEIDWSTEGRILEARLILCPELELVDTMTYHWDDQGRLARQTATSYPGEDICVYHYEDAP